VLTALLYGVGIVLAGAAVWRELERLARDHDAINRRDIDKESPGS
jgi:hypothetical protein